MPKLTTTQQQKPPVPERQIDKMVYALYGLTPEKIAIVEGKEFLRLPLFLFQNYPVF